MSWPYHPELLARRVPRYTSYPTAAEFNENVGAGDMEQALASLDPSETISLYLHIPYCHEICWYCGCNTGAANKVGRLASYLAALIEEIGLVADRISGTARVGRIAFGGGSPNALSGAQMADLIEQVNNRFDTASSLLSVEIDPRQLKDDFVSALADAGVRQASLGVQTFSDQIQRRIGRVQPAHLIDHAVEQLRGAGVASLNFDLMYGLPGQTLADLQSTLAQSVAFGADRIALFGYAHLPELVARQRRISAADLPGEAERFEMASAGYDFLVEAGYRPVGFDHFALPGDPLAQAARRGRLRRNFQGFTDDGSKTLIGLGASAISESPGLLAQNEKNSGRYRMLTSSGRLAAVRGIARDADDRRRGAIIESLLCRGEAQIEAVPDGLEPFVARDVVRLVGNRLRLTPSGLPYARSVAALFDRHRVHGGGRFSAAV